MFLSRIQLRFGCTSGTNALKCRLLNKYLACLEDYFVAACCIAGMLYLEFSVYNDIAPAFLQHLSQHLKSHLNRLIERTSALELDTNEGILWLLSVGAIAESLSCTCEDNASSELPLWHTRQFNDLVGRFNLSSLQQMHTILGRFPCKEALLNRLQLETAR
jgi:hypothetical protein